jgi:hypothetical protein
VPGARRSSSPRRPPPKPAALAVTDDREAFVGIDDAFGVPLRDETPQFGFVVSLAAIDTTPPDPAPSRAPGEARPPAATRRDGRRC